MADLTYDHAGLSADAIGEPFGIEPDQRRALRPRLREALDTIEVCHEHGELGFLDLPDRDPSPITSWAERKRDGPWTDVVVLGIGGSSLGTRALHDAARPEDLEGGPTLHVSEDIDPERLATLLDPLPLETTLFVVVTKSGTTVETMSQFAFFYGELVEALDAERADERIVAVTDPDSGGLRRLAEQRGFESFAIPPEVGGRFSVLSPVGLVPLALAGYPVGDLLGGARAARNLALGRPPEANPLFEATADLYTLYERGISEIVMMAYGRRLEPLVDWFRQLWAESLGKADDRKGETVHAGMTPVKASGPIDQHSQVQLYMEGPATRVVVFLARETSETDLAVPEEALLPDDLAHLEGCSFEEIVEAELEGTDRALRRVGRPTARWTFDSPTPRSVGGFVMAWELITALMGELLDVDAFDQPGVELGKRLAHERLSSEDDDVDDGAAPSSTRHAIVPSRSASDRA